MNLTNWNFFKIIISISIVILSIYFMREGFILLNESKFKVANIKIENKKIEKNLKNKLLDTEKKNKILKELAQSKIDNVKNNVKLDKNLYEKLILVKKNDTFTEIIDPFFSDKKLKNSLINSIQNEINLKNLSINQKIYFYFDDKNIVKKIKIPINFDTFWSLILKINLKLKTLGKR